jgi:hypothetical protein
MPPRVSQPHSQLFLTTLETSVSNPRQHVEQISRSEFRGQISRLDIKGVWEMIGRRPWRTTSRTEKANDLDSFHDWVLSLPWVVERSSWLATPGIRSFGIDCEPLAQRRLWIVTGLWKSIDCSEISVFLPIGVARDMEDAGQGRCLVPMPDQHVLMSVNYARPRDIEACALLAYDYAVS